ncbi:pseudouridine synthase [Gracilibacillus dipsosauri]|uniref:Pseudouridine synthase n=1 Tax=Gracilibacillus dipsosauri TaxID=178340 RepID=A0A317L5T4_9BACI|nr:pseudouridine synthase [Gracilibacillus dipsosauri]PWU70258.1 16S rRNA pseudouridine(516) synthase [Gracilibacillus dipsosauri]
MRLDKLLANMGIGSRKEVKELIKKKSVSVNGKIIKSNLSIDPEFDRIECNGQVVEYQKYVYFMLHKPSGYLSATRDQEQKTVLDLLKTEDQARSPFPVGRLDKNTEGLLLLTNDGQLAHELLSPKKHVDKTYFAKISGFVTENDVAEFLQGVDIGDYITKPAKLKILKAKEVSEIEVTITEGKFHQVKRMFEAVGKEVLYLKRLTMGSLELDSTLKLGQYRALTDQEIQNILEETKG